MSDVCELSADEFHKIAPRMSVSVGAVVRWEKQVLFVRQTYGKMKGCWGLPSGFVDKGETPDMAALREVREETGVDAELRGLLAVTHIDWEGEPQVYLVFLYERVSGHPQPDGTENDRAAFLTLEEIDAFDEPIDKLCKWIARRVLDDAHPLSILAPFDTRSLDPDYWTTFI
jgi:ADP-ribose pyrophosphatase YjhB (NUDIX family)